MSYDIDRNNQLTSSEEMKSDFNAVYFKNILKFFYFFIFVLK
jgi:hypothetical protein